MKTNILLKVFVKPLKCLKSEENICLLFLLFIGD